MPGADVSAVSHKALERGLGQVGSLGSGNHFLELQVVDEVRGRDGGVRLRPRRRPGRGDDPLRLARLRPPDLHRPRGAHGERGGARRHRAAGPAARLRAAGLARGPRLSGGHGLRLQLRLRQPPDDAARGARRLRAGLRTELGAPRRGAALRRGPQHRQARGASASTAPSAPCGCTARGRRGPTAPVAPSCLRRTAPWASRS